MQYNDLEEKLDLGGTSAWNLPLFPAQSHALTLTFPAVERHWEAERKHLAPMCTLRLLSKSSQSQPHPSGRAELSDWEGKRSSQLQNVKACPQLGEG